jgi:hypothetical protein
MLMAFADESDAGSKVTGILTVTGYVGFYKSWEKFAQQWDDVIKQDPNFSKIGYFKSIALRSNKWLKEHGVTKGDANRVHQKLIPIIQRWYQEFSVVATISCEDHAKIIVPGPLGTHPWLNHPYYFCYHAFVSAALWHAASRLNIKNDQIDFVFDRNAPVTDRANEMFRAIREGPGISPIIKELMGEAIPGDDKKLPPLQAADLLAGRVKDHCMKPRNVKLYRNVLAISGSGKHNVTCHLRSRHLKRFTGSFSEAELNSLTEVENGGLGS